MRRVLAVTVLVCGILSTQVTAQGTRPVRIAGHFTGTMFDGPFDNLLVGGRVLIPVSDRVDVYPSVSRRVEGLGAAWHVSLALQWRPFGSPDRTPFYLAMGWMGLNNGNSGEGFDLWAPGVEIPAGRLRPYAELQFLGPLRHVANPQAGFGVQAQFGLTWATR
jgi:hypothetical protein